MFAAAIVPLVLGVGVAVDYSRGASIKAELQNAVDGVALMAIKLPSDQRERAARRALAARMTRPDVRIDEQSWRTNADQTFTGTISANLPTGVMQIVGRDEITAHASATVAPPPQMPLVSTFTPSDASGWYWKKVEVWSRPQGSASDVLLATYIYQTEFFDRAARNGNMGSGQMTAHPSGPITFSPYDKLYLRMVVRSNGCEPGKSAAPGTGRGGIALVCQPNPSDVAAFVARTDDPALSNYLFVNGVQLPVGVVVPITDILKCGQTAQHAWEDGGNFVAQDFFFNVTTSCGTANWMAARLIR